LGRNHLQAGHVSASQESIEEANSPKEHFGGNKQLNQHASEARLSDIGAANNQNY